MSTDEMTAIQALERAAPTQPMRPGRAERREFEYIRHGTLSLIANFEVATGRIVMPWLGPTRTEADFAAHIERTIASDGPQYGRANGTSVLTTAHAEGAWAIASSASLRRQSRSTRASDRRYTCWNAVGFPARTCRSRR